MQRRETVSEEIMHRAEDEAAREAARTAPLPRGGVALAMPISLATPMQRKARVFLVLIGTFAKGIADDLCQMLTTAGLGDMLGVALMVELDGGKSEAFLATCPEALRDRIISVRAAGLSAGAGNRPPDEVDDLKLYWGSPLGHGVDAACTRYLALYDEEPGLIVPIVSQGGQASIGVAAVAMLRERFPTASIYGLTHLPINDYLREQVPNIITKYRQVGVGGFVIADNLQDEVRNDFGMVTTLTGFLAAAQQADTPVDINNAFRALFAYAPDQLVTFSTWVTSLPGHAFQPHPEVPARYYLDSDLLRVTILNGLSQVRYSGHALGLPGMDVPAQASVIDLVSTAIVPPDLTRVEDDVRESLQYVLLSRRNYGLTFASRATAVNPTDVRCPVTIVALRPVEGGMETIRELCAPVVETTPGMIRMPRSVPHVA
jgi:hypothetical protein